MRFRALFAFGLVVLAAASVHAQTAGMVSFQGLIRSTATGNPPITTPVSLEFRIFNTDTVGTGSLVDMDGDGTVENTAAAPGAGTDVILVGPLTPNGGIVSTKFGPVSPKAFTGCTLGVAGCRWLEVTVVGSGPLSRLEMVTPPGVAEQVNHPASSNAAVRPDNSGNVHIGSQIPRQALLYDEVGSATWPTYGFWARDYGMMMPTDTALGFSAAGATRMIIDNNGNVGIGTTSPVSRLHVKGGAISLNNAFSNSTPRPPIAPAPIAGQIHVLGVDGAGSDDGFLRLSAGGGSSTFEQSYIDISGYSSLPEMHDNIVLGTRGTERIRITDTGNVGIGTSTPTQKLEIRSNDAWFRFGGTNGADYTTTFSMDTTALKIGHNTLGRDIQLQTGSIPRLTIAGGGNVGIGTATPSAALHVQRAGGVASLVDNFQSSSAIATVAGSQGTALEYSGTLHLMAAAYASVGQGNGTSRMMVDSSGNVGIGTAAPAARLDVAASGDGVSVLRLSTERPWEFRQFGTGSNSELELRPTSGTKNFRITANDGGILGWFVGSSNPSLRNVILLPDGGTVGIGTNAPSQKLHVAGNIHADGNITASGTCCASDERFKRGIVSLSGALDRLLALRGVWYQWKDPKSHGDESRRQMGMIAQEVEKVLPEWVIKDKDGYRYLNTNGFPALAVEAIREMKNENDTLRTKVSALEDRLARLERALDDRPSSPRGAEKVSR